MAKSSVRGFLMTFITVILLLLVGGGVYYWQHGKVTDLQSDISNLNTQTSELNKQVTDRDNALAALPNTVIVTSDNTADLVAFLSSNNTQCYKQASNGNGYFKIDKEVDDMYAEMQYGCENTIKNSAGFILATKASGKWQLISPTNQWQTVSNVLYPSCTMVNDNKISKKLEPKCYVIADGSTTPTVQAVTNP